MQDNGYVYRSGDIYPRAGYTTTQRRIDELSGMANKQGMPLIKTRQKASVTVAEPVVEQSEDVPNEKSKRNRKKAK